MNGNGRTIHGAWVLALAAGAALGTGFTSRGVEKLNIQEFKTRPFPPPLKFPLDLNVSELRVTIKEWDVPTKGAHPHDPAVGMDGALWFTVQVRNFVGRLDPKNGKVELQKVPTANAHPYGIQVDSRGVPFFCEFFANKLASIDPKTMAIREYALPEGVRPRRMAIDATDHVYFTDYERGHLGRLDPKSGEVKMWNSPGGAGANPYGIAITPDGMVWYSESGVKPNTLIRFDPKTETMARTTIPSGGGTVRNMAATADGRVYIACSGVNKVGVVEPLRCRRTNQRRWRGYACAAAVAGSVN